MSAGLQTARKRTHRIEVFLSAVEIRNVSVAEYRIDIPLGVAHSLCMTRVVPCLRGKMEASEPVVRRRRELQFRTTEEKRLIVEETRRDGVSVAAVAQAHRVDANQVFYWRKLYEAGQLECTRPVPRHDLEAAGMRLLPVDG